MKNSLSMILVLLSGCFLAQGQNEIEAVEYCGTNFKVPQNCTARSAYEISCDSYVLQWLYMNEQMLQTMPHQFVRQLKSKVKRMKKEPVQCVSLNYPMDGYKISYKNKRQPIYKIVAYGPVNGQPVMVILTLQQEPTSNEQLPDFVKQIIQLQEM